MLSEAPEREVRCDPAAGARRPASRRSAVPVDRRELEDAARCLPASELKIMVLATLADRLPTPREALVWVAALQRPGKRGSRDRSE